jgi:hypothetical protein
VIAGSVRVEFPIFAWRSGCCSMLIVHLTVCDIPCGRPIVAGGVAHCCGRVSVGGLVQQWVV